jgi:hypothetical protein
VTPRIFSKLCPDDTGEYEVSAITEVTSQGDRDIGYPKGDKGFVDVIRCQSPRQHVRDTLRTHNCMVGRGEKGKACSP